MTITRETVLAMIGTTEGFSAEAVTEQLAVRAKAVAAQLARFREANNIIITTKETKEA